MDSLEAVQKSHQATCDWLRQMNDALRADLQKRAVTGEYMQHLESRFVDMCKKIDYVKKFIDSRHKAGFISFSTQEISKILGGN